MLQVEGLTIGYGGEPVLDGVDLAVAAGSSVALVGPSGSGKSTLILAMAGLQTPLSGRVVTAGQVVSGPDPEAAARVRRRSVGVVFQSGELLGELSLRENVALPLRMLGARRGPAMEQAAAALEELGLGGLGDRRPDQVSGGQAQRAAIARALIHEPAVILADEPTGAVGGAQAQMVSEALYQRSRSSGAALVIATHDEMVAASADRVVVVGGGRLVERISASG